MGPCVGMENFFIVFDTYTHQTSRFSRSPYISLAILNTVDPRFNKDTFIDTISFDIVDVDVSCLSGYGEILMIATSLHLVHIVFILRIFAIKVL
jgi:hypothetical protein